ncbi:NAD(P)H-dependent glycerol-3-phosphate dehydrogenase [Rhodopila sp.]|uniref:NAD(P)H-dependent glycerol-3-phosphate dehydrogenase n=1 Tax=Rhodopila sp. TaxID=2480087 RepID=UPI002BD39CA1|nr:NAD(P)H-dependent glycerol-3-phosphate dehydrogenase [Rhodopila sp.]HVZ09406.1 NAD(P)H-dependent glycerol-3-phosphate dehydrogenase [Rhodopila sp.]
MTKIAVLGAGAWGTALALQACRAGQAVTLVARDAAKAGQMRRDRLNPRLPGALLPESLRIADVAPVDAELVFVAVPTQHIRANMGRIGGTVPLVACAKGVEIGSHKLPLEILADAAPDHPLAVLTGPNFAHEVAAGLPAASVVASTDAALREAVRLAVGTPTFRLYGNDDPIGAQLGGAAKNVIAIAAGAVTGAGLGENARAALITRGLSELSRLTLALGGKAETVMGLSGLGDLLLTCTGAASRNFSLGVKLGEGHDLSTILAARTGVTEGVTTAAALVARAEAVDAGMVPANAGKIDMPICEAVAALLAGTLTLPDAMRQLLSRPQRDE